MSRSNEYVLALSDSELNQLVKDYDHYELSGIIGDSNLRSHVEKFSKSCGDDDFTHFFSWCTILMLATMREIIRRG